jgi:hypothetical protein
VNPVTLSLNTTVKLTGEALVGSAWPAAWLIVTDGATVSTTTELLKVLTAVQFPRMAVTWYRKAPSGTARSLQLVTVVSVVGDVPQAADVAPSLVRIRTA